MLICTINIVLGFFIVSADVEGKLIKEENCKYLVDFTEGLKKYPEAKNGEGYKQKLVNKEDCIILNK